MQVNRVNSNSVQKQSFGALKPVAPEIREYIHKEIFHNDSGLIDVFEKTVQEVTKKQAKNREFNVELIKHNDLMKGYSYPEVSILTKDGIQVDRLYPYLKNYQTLTKEQSTIKMIQDVNTIEPGVVTKVFNKIVLEKSINQLKALVEFENLTWRVYF